MTQLASATDVANNSLINQQTKQRGLAESIPLLGGFFKAILDFADNVQGVTDRIRVATTGMQQDAQRLAAEHQLAMGLASQRAQLIGARGPVAGWNAIGVQNYFAGAPSPSNIRQYEAFERQLEARAAADAARRSAIGYQSQVEKFSQTRVESNERAATLGRRGEHGVNALEVMVDQARTGGDKAGIAEWAQNVLGTLGQQKSAIEQVIEATNRERDAALSAANAESQVRKAGIEQQKAKLQLLKEEEQRSRGTMLAFGNLSQAERSLAVSYARQAKDQGFESLIPAQREMLRRAGAGEFVERGLERAAANDPLTAEFQGLIGQRQLSQISAEKVKATAEIQVNIQLDEKALAEQIAAITEKYTKQIEAFLKEQEQNKKSSDLIPWLLRRAGVGGGS